MDKFQSYAINHYLSDWPEEWGYKKIIKELQSGDEGLLIINHFHYDELVPEEMAEIIQDMVDSLKGVFSE